MKATNLINTPARRRWARHIQEHGIHDLVRRCWLSNDCQCNPCRGLRRARPFIGLLWDEQIIDQYTFEAEGWVFDLIDPTPQCPEGAPGTPGYVATAHEALPLFVAGPRWDAFMAELRERGLAPKSEPGSVEDLIDSLHRLGGLDRG